jgi:hypothetical protein
MRLGRKLGLGPQIDDPKIDKPQINKPKTDENV